jgi:hypothetical protein
MARARTGLGAGGTIARSLFWVALFRVAAFLSAALALMGTAGADPAPNSPGNPPGNSPGNSSGTSSTSSAAILRAQRGEVSPPDLDDIEHMCALLVSCDRLPIPPGLIPADFASCVKKMSDDLTSAGAVAFSLTMRECGLQANSCENLRSCALRGAKADACAGRGMHAVVGFCDVDGRALSCFGGSILAVRDCPRGGEQCAVRDGQAMCVLGPCPPDMKEGAPAQCSGSGLRILRCERSKLVSLDCAAFGLKCSPQADGAGCSTSSPACSGDARRCDGEVAVGCFNGHEVRVDCAAAGLVCNGAPGATAVGACFAQAPGANACDPGAPARCEGTSVKYCSGGKPRSFFCKPLGFNRCETTPHGARCAP